MFSGHGIFLLKNPSNPRPSAAGSLRNRQDGIGFNNSGRWESNPVYVLPKHAYYRYTTARTEKSNTEIEKAPLNRADTSQIGQ